MSKPWIQLYSNVFKHEKTLMVAEIIGVKPIIAGSHLIALWLWTIENRITGDLKGMTPGQIALACEYDGDPKIFLNALQTARYIDHDFKVHNWERYAGKLIAWREGNRKRMQLDRACKKAGIHFSKRTKNNMSMEEKKRARLNEWYALHPEQKPHRNGKH